MLLRILSSMGLCLVWQLCCFAEQSQVDFNRDIRPILSNHCFSCHGPDAEHRQAGLRLDEADPALAELDSGDRAIVPGDVEASTLVARIASDDEGELMPPADFHKPLSAKQKQLLTDWIAQGAPFSAHWSLLPPQKVDPPAISDPAIPVDGPIDQFIANKALEAGLSINPPADRRSLIRRATFDLTGLPPTLQEVRDFVDDQSPNAYEKLIDRLLESKRFGEHQARYWLDLVRYGDTHGLHLDNYREMWPYRDWVIAAINDNKPLDEFITEQLAGDLIPNATLQQQIASGFNRLNVTTSEGGSIYDEVYVRNCVDRVSAFGTVFLGMTTGCAVCHDHKFDPISARDFYSLFAYFNSLDGRALDGNKKDHPPTVQVPTAEHESQLKQLREELQMLDVEMEGDLTGVDESQQRWEQRLSGGQAINWVPLIPDKVTTESELKLEQLEDGSVKATGTPAATDTLVIEAPVPAGDNWQLLQLEVLAEENKPGGISSNGNAVLTEMEVEIASPMSGNRWLPVKLIYGEADYEQPDGKFAIGYAFDGKQDKDAGWAIGGHLNPGTRSAWFVASSFLSDGADSRLRIKLHFKSQWAGHQFGQVRLSVSDAVPQPAADQQLVLGDWDQTGPFPVEYAAAGYYRTFASEGREFKADEKFSNRELPWTKQPAYANAAAHDLPTVGDEPSVVVLHRTIEAKTPQKVTLLLGTQDGYVLYVNKKKQGEVKQQRDFASLRDEYEVDLKKGVNHIDLKVVSHGGRPSRFAFAVRSPSAPVPASIVEIAKLDAAARTGDQADAIRAYYRRVASIDPDWLVLRAQKDGILNQIDAVEKSFPTTLVWKELKEPRPAHILLRGEYDQKGEEVPRAVPAALPPLPEGVPNDRMGLAKWLTDPSHPLTARVAVNRYWQQLFGTGIVKTSEDFGAQGEPPSHPQLLDWLAIDFRDSGWDVKRMIKQIMMSQTYRRDQHVSPKQREIDPSNRLLARGARFRLDAEMLRDQALMASGLLVEKQGGPSVKPPQPEGLWEAVGYSGSDTVNFKPDSGEKIYRRSLYTFWKRTSAPPTMTMLDAPSRESCTARRERTNTPLQALMMLNELQFVECSRNLGQRVIAEGGSDDAQKIAWAFETLTSRVPSETETAELIGLLNDARAAFGKDPENANRLIKLGQSPTPDSIDPIELAAWTAVASTLINLDEVVTK
ncbi:PSD1 and planctomycete cytochrome C domain-containing protein [Rosistilla oblonga]|uniref:Planctomycete cytochrome C n=1 Tax=Rosistilla oblonga TaxID=2527990 RepID=A0A518IMG9_9BACT|nr:PSD1 and planctomycete cytochrome C domain-containing protein [Rosistilla oblonga]QDV54290.1 Planctomycete cytochrome C [Rosistilla oblonga]